MTSRAVNGQVPEAEDGASPYVEEMKHDHRSSHQAEDDAISSRDVLTKKILEAINIDDFDRVQALLANASEMDKECVLLRPYGESGTGLRGGTTPLLHAATRSQPETFKELVRASPRDKIVEMLKAKDQLGHTVLMVAVASKSVGTFEAVSKAVKDDFDDSEQRRLIEAQDKHGRTLFTAAVQGGSSKMFEATLDHALGILFHDEIVPLLTAKDRPGPTVLMAAASSESTDTFEAIFKASEGYFHKGQLVDMLKAKDHDGHTIFTAAVSSERVDTFETVFQTAKKGLHQEQLWQLIESIDNKGGTLLSAAVQSGRDAMFEATLDYALESVGHHELCVLIEHKNKDGQTLLFSAPFELSRKLWLKSLESGHFGFFESVARVVPPGHRSQVLN
ncbi:conserved unknown protein [Ectocarpus siliculosus]|uniref:Uncharacterized protein n=1 Tax=Ectocarpus siliculosus TaxID=2880 RepID=D7FL47_ECTSI|nr:conserved unknown protein [Ectocarpus siliculosus]|eukprot:CBJ29584.1 conserved unknown protein [Ectocarpus siliculosus]